MAPQTPNDWSPDGRQIAFSAGTRVVLAYSVERRTYRRIADGNAAAWLGDGRRIVHSSGGRLFVTDVESGASHGVLAMPGETLSSPRFASGDSQLFFLRSITDGDIWTMRFAADQRSDSRR